MHLKLIPTLPPDRPAPSRKGGALGRIIARAVAACAIAAVVPCASAETSPAQITLIKAGRLFDGTNVYTDRSVLVRGRRIADANFKGKAPKGATVVECAECTLLPGLIDSHVHAFENQDLPLLAGVTTQLDMFMSTAQAAQIRRRMHDDMLDGQADLYSAGTLATAPGGHGTEFGLDIPTVSSAREADAFVRERLQEGSDYIKIILESKPGVPALDAATVKALIDSAHRHHRLAIVNISNQAAAKTAIRDGADGLSHMFADSRVDDEFLALAKKSGVFILSTYTVKEVNSGRSGGTGILNTPDLARVLTRRQRNMLRYRTAITDTSGELDEILKFNFSALKKNDIPILAGTDSGNPGLLHGFSLHRELELLVQAGLTPLEALRSASSVPAKHFHLSDRGQIVKKAKADLLLVKGDPTQDIVRTRAVQHVWKNGVSNDAARLERANYVTETLADKPQAMDLPAGHKLSLFSRLPDGSKPDGLKMDAPIGEWMETSDSAVGGHSKMTLSAGTGPHGEIAAKVQGEIRAGFGFPWAGLSFMPGKRMYEAVDLSGTRGIRFQMRGKDAPFQIQVFCEEGGFRPITLDLVPSDKWQEYEVLWTQLGAFNPATVTAIAFAAAQRLGPFAFEVSDVEILKN